MKTRMKNSALILLALLPLAGVAAESPAKLGDYRRGVALVVPEGKPLIELELPDVVYENVTRPDLGDMRVFNKDDQPVPHTLCAARAWSEPGIENRNLPVFPLQAGAKPGREATHVEIATAAGTHVSVDDAAKSSSSPKRPEVRAHVIDASSLRRDIRALSIDWETPDGASEVQVRVEASNDLDKWREIVGTSTLLQARGTDGSLQRQRVAVPQGSYKYLRLERVDGGPALRINEVTAEVVLPIERVEPRWFSAQATPVAATANATVPDAGAFDFDAGRLALVNYGRIKFSRDNSSVHLELLSRPASTQPWRSRWEGEVYAVLADGVRRDTPPVEIGPTTDRYWRVRAADSQALSTAGPALELGYYPARLRFLAQGTGPFTLAFGSARAEPIVSSTCGTLLTNFSPNDAAQLTAMAVAGDMRELGGEIALQPRPKPTPMRLIVLWATLFFGAVVVALMAMSLLKRVRKPG